MARMDGQIAMVIEQDTSRKDILEKEEKQKFVAEKKDLAFNNKVLIQLAVKW
jgi:hypothetical protein